MPVSIDEIGETPFEDGPRLAYAAWMETADPALAEWIRTQVFITRAPVGKTWQPRKVFKDGKWRRAEPELTSVEAAERDEWHNARYRETELLAEHRDRWLEPLRELVPDLTARFDRGFPAEITLAASSWCEHGPRLLGRAPIVSVVLRAMDVSAAELAIAPNWQRTRALSLQNCQLDDGFLASFLEGVSLPELWRLDLRGNALTDVGMRALAAAKPSLPRLRFVDCDQNGFDPRETYGVEWGWIQDIRMSDLGLALEAEFGPLPWLRRMVAVGEDFDWEMAAAPDALEVPPTLD